MEKQRVVTNSKLTPAEIVGLAPAFTREMRRLFDKRVVGLAEHYGERIHSWDVVNESATDYARGAMIPGDAICKSHYGLMPGDYTYEAFQAVDRAFPASVVLNINDYLNNEKYAEQTKELLARGCRIDVLGSQMHLFNPQQCLDIADGKPLVTPDSIWRQMEILATAGLPIHLSEITITSPDNDERGKAIQAVIARNLYRLWFSIEPKCIWEAGLEFCSGSRSPPNARLTRDHSRGTSVVLEPNGRAADRLWGLRIVVDFSGRATTRAGELSNGRVRAR